MMAMLSFSGNMLSVVSAMFRFFWGYVKLFFNQGKYFVHSRYTYFSSQGMFQSLRVHFCLNRSMRSRCSIRIDNSLIRIDYQAYVLSRTRETTLRIPA